MAPKRQTSPGRKCAPETVTTVPPYMGPCSGCTASTEGLSVKANGRALRPQSWPLSVSLSATVAGGCRGVRQRTWVEDIQIPGLTAPPKEHASSEVLKKLLPVIVTRVPPEASASAGKTLSSSGSLTDSNTAPASVLYASPSKVAPTTRPPSRDATVVHTGRPKASRWLKPAPPKRHAPEVFACGSRSRARLVPPRTEPKVGERPDKRGGSTYRMVSPVWLKSAPLLLVTSSPTTPAPCAGATQRTSLSDASSAGTTSSPNRQSVPKALKLRPVTTRTVPPRVETVLGLTSVTTMAGSYRKVTAEGN
mmetsp:Transcript_9505/g.21583  ORF Transcript_9505/g.21583 Transcript_9505/m.21583 type:complete len:307 (-) Transcript_9505:1650-2570(-)